MRILVTGCFGFIGSNLVPNFLNEMHEVIGFDNLSSVMSDVSSRIKQNSGSTWANFKFFKQDVKSFESMHTILTHERPELIIHLAASGSVPRSFENPSDYVDNNERGFVNICKIAKHLGIKRVVYASSSSVYGESKAAEKSESDPLNPMSPYAVSKLQNELFAEVWSGYTNIEFVGLRFFNVYGPGQNITVKNRAAIPEFITNTKPNVFGDGSAQRDFTYVDDVCQGITLAAFQNLKEKNLVLNIGANQSHSLNSILTLLNKKAEYVNPRVGDIQNSKANISKAKLILGYMPHVSLKEGIEKTVYYYSNLRV